MIQIDILTKLLYHIHVNVQKESFVCMGASIDAAKRDEAIMPA